MKHAIIASALTAVVLLAGCSVPTEPRATVTCSGDEHMTPYGCRRKS